MERSLYLKPHERVNTILTHFLRLTPLARPGVVRRLRSATGSVHAQPQRTRSEAIAHHPSWVATIFALAKDITVSAEVWDEALLSAQISASASV